MKSFAQRSSKSCRQLRGYKYSENSNTKSIFNIKTNNCGSKLLGNTPLTCEFTNSSSLTLRMRLMLVIITRAKPHHLTRGIKLHKLHSQSLWWTGWTVCELTGVLPKKFTSTAILFDVQQGSYVAILIIFTSSQLSVALGWPMRERFHHYVLLVNVIQHSMRQTIL